MNNSLDKDCVNTIRFLAADAVQKAGSGHPGLPMGAAPMAYVLWTKHLRHNPSNPRWINRDRFVLSAGHGSMLLYALLHLTGYDLPLKELQSFRQWESMTPGHPESRITPGVEITTGPLGQGISSSVGMAMAEAHLAATYNRPGHTLIDHNTYVLASDGDLMEGVACEACSLAGHLGLGKLIVLYDSNGISLAGSTGLCFTEDVGKRLEACGWHTLRLSDGEDLSAIDKALDEAKSVKDKPSILIINTVIDACSPNKQGTFEVHGSPLGEVELRLAKKSSGFPDNEMFFVPGDVAEHLAGTKMRGRALEFDWQQCFFRYRSSFPDPAEEFRLRMTSGLPAGWENGLDFLPEETPISTRKASEKLMQLLPSNIPAFMGGSADLNPSTLTWFKAGGNFENPRIEDRELQGALGGVWGYEGKNIHFGVREHAMAAIATGMALHGGIIPYVSTFLMFSDYMRPAIRIACLTGARVIYVFTHDSIGLGEDGPTHQPIEHLMGLRGIPNLTLIRPCDTAETREAFRVALGKTDGPTAIILTRQDLPQLDRKIYASGECLERGGYILWQSAETTPDVILIGTGSEVQVALDAAVKLAGDGFNVRVVSLPCWDIFDRQTAKYRSFVLPPEVKARVAIEAGLKCGWEHYVGLDGKILGMEGFGASAPARVLYEKFGLTVENVINAARACVHGKIPDTEERI